MKILQQNLPKQNLFKIVQTTGPSGSYCFSGPEGVGKKMMANYFAKISNCLDPQSETGYCGTCRVCKDLARIQMDHPDIILFEKADEPVGIERNTYISSINLDDENNYFKACELLFESKFIIRPVLPFTSETPVDFFYRNPDMLLNVSGKIMDYYGKITGAGSNDPVNVTAGHLVHDLFLGRSRGCYKDSIKIKDIHTFVRQSIEMAPLHFKYKFYILDDAHLLTDEAQNAMLKILEEPPAKTIFVLVTNLPHNLLPTILSRTNKIYFQPISADTIKDEIIRKRGESLERAEVIAAYARGSLSKALKTDGDKFFEKRSRVLKALDLLNGLEEYSWASASRIFSNTDIAVARERSVELIDRLRILSSLFNDMELILLKMPDRRIHSDIDEQAMISLLQVFSPDEIVKITDWIEKSIEGFEVNRDVLLTIEKLFISINSIVKKNLNSKRR